MKGQAAFEFMMIMSFLILIMSFYVLAFQYQFDPRGIQQKLSNICSNIASKIDNAYYFGIGFRQNVTLPDNVGGQTYTITAGDKILLCKAGKAVAIENFLANITNSTGNPPFNIKTRETKIENINNVVVIS